MASVPLHRGRDQPNVSKHETCSRIVHMYIVWNQHISVYKVKKILLTGLRRDSSFFDGTFGAERGFDRTLAKTEGPTELAQLVIVSRRTLTMRSPG